MWYVAGLLAVVNVFNYLDRMAFSILAPLIKGDLHLSDAQLGLLSGFAFALFYGVCGIPMAMWADRGSRKNVIAISLTVWSTMAALTGAANNFWHLLIARIGIGAGESGCLPPSQSILCDYVPREKRPAAFAVNDFGLYVGMMLGLALGGWLGEILGWRYTFAVLGLPGVALAAVVFLSLREPTRGLSDPGIQVTSSFGFRVTFVRLATLKTYRTLLLFNICNGFVQYGINQWWPSLLERAYGLSLSETGIMLGMAMGFGSAAGLLLGGLLGVRAGRKRVDLPLKLSACAIAFSIVTVVLGLFAPTSELALVSMTTTSFLWTVPNGAAIAAQYSVVVPRMRALSGAINIFFISALGFGFGPLSVGLLSDALVGTHGNDSLRFALLLPAAALPIMTVLLVRASNTLGRDLDAISELK